MATIFYARVSTADQSLEHQRTQAESAGFNIDQVVADHGVSGVSTALRDRPEGKRLFDLLRRGDTLVVRWVDRLGRSYLDVTEVIREFIARGVIVQTVINRMTFDGSTVNPIEMAVRDALVGFMAATAQAQAEAMKSAQRAGIDAAKRRPGTYLGRRPTYNHANIDEVLHMLGQGISPSTVASTTGLSRQTVYRIKHDPQGAIAALEAWLN